MIKKIVGASFLFTIILLSALTIAPALSDAQATSTVPGCTSTSGFSSVTGGPCNGTATSTTPTSCLITGQLNVGSSGSQVLCLQSFLNTRGFLAGGVTGYYGDLTRSAVAKWQAAVGLPATGYIGPISIAKLNTVIGNIAVEEKTARVALVGSPKLALAPHPVTRESMVVGTWEVAITPGTKEVRLIDKGTTIDVLSNGNPVNIPSDAPIVFTPKRMSPVTTSVDAYGRKIFIIAPGRTGIITITRSFAAAKAFSGSYTQSLIALHSSDPANIDNTYTLNVPTNKTKALTVVGEKVPTVALVGAPKLALTLDPTTKNSMVTGTWVVTIAAGMKDLKVLQDNGAVEILSKGSHITTPNNGNASMVPKSAGVPTSVDPAYGTIYTVPVGKSYQFTVTKSFRADLAFAGTYTESLKTLYGFYNNLEKGDLVTLYVPNNKTNALVVVGETAPLIESITPNPVKAGGVLTLKGLRFPQGIANVNIAGKDYRAASSPVAKQATVTIPPALAPGVYPVYIYGTSANSGKSNTVSLTVGTPSISVLAPNGGETFNNTDKISVSYAGVNLSDTLEVILYHPLNGEMAKKTVTNTAPFGTGKGLIELDLAKDKVADIIKAGSDYRIGICDHKNSPLGLSGKSLCDYSDSFITINNAVSNIQLNFTGVWDGKKVVDVNTLPERTLNVDLGTGIFLTGQFQIYGSSEGHASSTKISFGDGTFVTTNYKQAGSGGISTSIKRYSAAGLYTVELELVTSIGKKAFAEPVFIRVNDTSQGTLGGVRLVSTSANVLGEDANVGEFRFTVDVTAEDKDAFVELSASRGTTSAGAGFNVIILDGNGAWVTSGTTTFSIEADQDETTNNRIKVLEGDTVRFNVTTFFDPLTAGAYRAVLSSVNFNTVDADPNMAHVLIPQTDYRTNTTFINNTQTASITSQSAATLESIQKILKEIGKKLKK